VIRRLLTSFLADTRGTNTMEYLALGALVVALGVVMVNALLTSANAKGSAANTYIQGLPNP